MEELKLNIIKQINQALGKDLIKSEHIVYPPESKMGDLSLPCFDLAKELSKTPNEVAKDLAKKIDAKADGPYLNFNIDKQSLISEILAEINNEYGTNQDGEGKKIMIEYSNVNTHKEYHVGHLRNIAYGDAVDRLLLTNGYDAIPVTYVNDFGIHVAKTLWAWKKREQTDAEDMGYLIGHTYVQAVKELEDNESGMIEVAEIMKNIESRQGEDYELWEQTRQWSLDYFQSIYQNLKVKFERSYYESQFVEDGIKLVEDLLKKNILKKSEGAVIADLGDDLGVLVFVRSDGTALYPVADLALAVTKLKEKLFKSIYVVDNRQTLYFKQLFKVLELMGHKEEMVHLAYDFVKLPSGMMSSRSGNTITFKELYDQVLTKVIEEIKSRHNWPDDKVQETAQIMAIGVLKFEMLKVSSSKVINFNIKEALRFDGFTSVYLQYTSARINSILRKEQPDNPDFSQLTGKLEQNLVWHLAKYPLAVSIAAKDYEPSQIAKYLFDLSKLFNDYYHQIPVLKADNKVKQARLVLISAIKQVLSNGLDLLGIEIVEEM
ncbi:MAG: arginine--tRNA ligase [bacterium]